MSVFCDSFLCSISLLLLTCSLSCTVSKIVLKYDCSFIHVKSLLLLLPIYLFTAAAIAAHTNKTQHTNNIDGKEKEKKEERKERKEEQRKEKEREKEKEEVEEEGVEEE